jgi:hypothetical protein
LTALNSYSTGTVSISDGDTAIVGAGTIWSGVNARGGDVIIVDGMAPVEIKDVTDTAHLALWAPWSGGNKSAVSYTIVQKSPLRFAGGDVMAQVNQMVAALNTDGFYVFVPSIATVPDPSYGNDGQYAFQASTGKLWIKTGGAWVFQGIYKAFGTAAPWSAATAYNVNDVATLGGSSYVCLLAHTNHTPPNATYWSVLASIGATGATPLNPVAAWVTATSYAVGPPADYVSQGGSSYQCLVAHTSGTFATDLAAGKWGLVAQAGTNGANGIGYAGTSATSLLIANSVSKVFTTQSGLGYNGARVRAASNANPANYMEGVCTYSGTTLTMTVDAIGGTGTFADWVFSIAGQPGSAGAGALLAANNLSDVADKPTAIRNLGVPAIMRSYLAGLTLSTAGASSTFGIAPGVATDSTNTDVMALASAYTKTTSAWAVGTGNGALDTGTIAANTWYHAYLIKRPDTGVVDVLISLSATAPTLPANYTLFRRIGSMKADGSSQWVAFSQNGDEFLWLAQVDDASAVAVPASATLVTLSVPLGVKVNVLLNVQQTYANSTPTNLQVYSPDQPTTGTVGVSLAITGSVVDSVNVRTNTSSQVYVKGSSANGTYYITTLGWNDRRGRDA